MTENSQGRLEGFDDLPLDFSVTEVWTIRTILSSSAHQLRFGHAVIHETMTSGAYSSSDGTRLTLVKPVLVGYSPITTGDESLWNIDINTFPWEEPFHDMMILLFVGGSNFGSNRRL